MKPHIGVLVSANCVIYANRVDLAYMHAVEKAGGTPVLITPIPDSDFTNLVRTLDAIILIGDDRQHMSLNGDRAEDDSAERIAEIEFVTQAIKLSDRPILGICNGAELINQVLGGTLDKKISRKADLTIEGRIRKEVTFSLSSRIAGIYRKPKEVIPAFQRRDIDELGENLVCSARADDGLIEAFELASDRFLLGIHWHPEDDLPRHFPLFQSLVAAAMQQAVC